MAQLAEWCGANNLSLKEEKTNKVVMDFRRNPLTIDSSAAPNFWGCTSQRISLGPPNHSPRRHNSNYTFTASWQEQVSLQPSSPHSIWEPLNACWPVESMSGMGTVALQTRQWTVNTAAKIIVAFFRPSWPFSLHDAQAKPPALWRTGLISPTVSSSSYRQEGGIRASESALPECTTTFSSSDYL